MLVHRWLALTLCFGAATLNIGCGAAFKGASYESASDRGASPAASGALDLASELLAPEMASPEEAGAKAKPAVKTWKRSAALPNSSRLKIGDKEELVLEAIQAAVQIDGFRARVLLDYSYYNDRDGQFEGTFQLRLPQGATPYFLAFGPWTLVGDDGSIPEGALIAAERARQSGFDEASILEARAEQWTGPKVARIVPREKAQFAYKSTVRRKVDPALMEWAGAGVFQARVFPLLPKKSHRIVIGYDLDLTRAGADWELVIGLPEKARTRVLDLMIRRLPGLTPGVAPESAAVREGDRDCYRFEGDATRELRVRLPGLGPVLLVGEDAKLGPRFAAAIRPEIPADEGGDAAQEALFLLDTSLSANPDQFNVMLALLKALLDNNRDAIERFNVLFFNIEARWYRQAWAPNTPEEVERCLAAASELVLEGATDLSLALREARRPAWSEGGSRGDVFLLSDGAGTWGESSVPALASMLEGRGRLFAYNTGMRGLDRRALNTLTRESGGAVFSVVGEGEVASASRAHRKRSWRLKGLTIEGGDDLLIAGRPTVVYPGQPLLVCGRGAPEAGAKLRLSLERDGKTREVVVEGFRRLASELTARVYGAVAVAQIEELGPASERLARAYSIHYRVPGSTCSLLMLESEEDYRRFEIKPEDEARVVAEQPAGRAGEEARAELAGSLADPKGGFLSFLAGLERSPILGFKASEGFREALRAMPVEAFKVEPEALVCELRRRADVDSALLEALARRAIDYDSLTAESERRRKSGAPADALKALSTLVEHSPGDLVLMRDVAFSAMELELYGHAYHLLRRVASARPDEPQTYHNAALCLQEMGRADLALAYFEVALHGLWGGRFGELRTIVALDYLRLLRAIDKGEAASSVKEYARERARSLGQEIKLEDAALVITMSWNTDNTDIDLHVWEPDGGFFDWSGEHCFYENPRTSIGGRLTRDVTSGYGPEMYVLKTKRPGTYKVKARYFSSDANRASTRTKVYATIYQDWGTDQERVTRKVVTLERGKEMHSLVELEVR